MDLFCRVTVGYEVLKPLTVHLNEHSNKYIFYEHNDDQLNIHTHFYISGYAMSTDTLKQKIKKVTGLNFKATSWSFKRQYKPAKDVPEIPVTDSCITYMAKGKLEPCAKHGFTDSYILDLRANWVDYKRQAKQQRLTSYIIKESQAASKLRQDEMITEIVSRLDKQDDQTAERIIGLIRQVVIIENKTILGRYKCRDYYDTIRARQNPGSWCQSMLSLVQDKMFV